MRSPIRWPIRWPIRCLCGVLLALSLTLSAGTAEAASGEHELWLGAGVGTPTISGVVHGRYRYCLTDFWALGSSLEQGVDAKGAHTAATVDARLTIDALTFVPSVVAGVGARVASPAQLGAAGPCSGGGHRAQRRGTGWPRGRLGPTLEPGFRP